MQYEGGGNGGAEAELKGHGEESGALTEIGRAQSEMEGLA